MNKTDRINLRAKTAINKLTILEAGMWNIRKWNGISKISMNRKYQISDGELDQALEENSEVFIALHERFANYL